MPLQSFPTSPHPDCHRCANPVHALYIFVSEDGVYPTGDIFSLKESVHRPIEHMSSRLGIYSGRVDSHDPPWRPAIIWPTLEPTEPVQKQGELAEEGRYVCLMTGYRGAHAFEHLPHILQHFCLPVSPHGLGDSERPRHHHVHTTPEWQESHKWFIAYPFVSHGPIRGRWCWVDSERNKSSHAGFKIAQEPLSELDEICTEKFNEWNMLCIQEPEELKEYSDEYDVSVAFPSHSLYVEFMNAVDVQGSSTRAEVSGQWTAYILLTIDSYNPRSQNASRATFRTTTSAVPAETSTQAPATPPVVPPPPASASPPVEDSGVGRGRGRGRWVRGVWRAFKRGRARGQSRA